MSAPTTWRDYADRLTAEQIALMEYCEANELPPGIASPESHINAALTMIRENETQAACAHIPTPPDALDVPAPWLPWDDDVAQRTYTCWAQQMPGVAVTIIGYQYSDGRPVYREIYVEDSDDACDMTADRARMLGRLLLDAADALDRLDGTSPPFM